MFLSLESRLIVRIARRGLRSGQGLFHMEDIASLDFVIFRAFSRVPLYSLLYWDFWTAGFYCPNGKSNMEETETLLFTECGNIGWFSSLRDVGIGGSLRSLCSCCTGAVAWAYWQLWLLRTSFFDRTIEGWWDTNGIVYWVGVVH